jgi:hypothetical protein
LDIEERVLKAYKDAEKRVNMAMEQRKGGTEMRQKEGERIGGGETQHQLTDDETSSEIVFLVDDFVQRIRCTKRKIGRIHHTGMGRFDLALLSSVST